MLVQLAGGFGLEDEGDIRVGRGDVFAEFDDGLVNMRDAILLCDEHVARWGGPLQAEQVVLLCFCASMGINICSHTIQLHARGEYTYLEIWEQCAAQAPRCLLSHGMALYMRSLDSTA